MLAEMTRIYTDLHQGVQKLRNLDAHLNWKNHDLVKQKIVFQELFETEDHGDESAFGINTEAAHIPSHGGRLLLHVLEDGCLFPRRERLPNTTMAIPSRQTHQKTYLSNHLWIGRKL